MFRRIPILSMLLLFAIVPVWAQVQPVPSGFVEDFADNPLNDAALVLRGGALDRLTWEDSPPAFAGDPAGSLAALYDSTMAPGLVGWSLSESFGPDDPFTALAVLTFDPDRFEADPNGFFQISWGLWNSESTGLERTGNPSNFASDTFELIEFDYFPNVSPFFGGPFLSPSLFGVANRADPSFDFLGGFVNFSFGNVEVELPLGQPLIAVLQHRPADDVMVVSVSRLSAAGGIVPLPGAVTVVPLDALPIRDYQVDTVGLTLWRDGFSGPVPSVRAVTHFHRLQVVPGVAIPRLGE